ncbi:dihydroorotate dehydrogenase [Ciborinia camelliae]|nr:dihydroorotate dehydrogenase [Ciborinia camelliae]
MDWATTKADLLALYSCPHTGAVTIRTSLLNPFPHESRLHQYTFFDPKFNSTRASISAGRSNVIPGETNSLNTLGYSPLSLDSYLDILLELARDEDFQRLTPKPWIVSVTGSAEEVGECYRHILRQHGKSNLNLMMEINLSCPNIVGKPPPAYDQEAMASYIKVIGSVKAKAPVGIPVGIKTPPYTYSEQFQNLISALESGASLGGSNPISFITATNTLGSCLVVDGLGNPALGSSTGEGIGGMAGDALHPIALGNVKTIRRMLDASTFEGVRKMEIIGVGGVKDSAGFSRMRNVGASIVGVGTALGREGVALDKRFLAAVTIRLNGQHLFLVQSTRDEKGFKIVKLSIASIPHIPQYRDSDKPPRVASKSTLFAPPSFASLAWNWDRDRERAGPGMLRSRRIFDECFRFGAGNWWLGGEVFMFLKCANCETEAADTDADTEAAESGRAISPTVLTKTPVEMEQPLSV